MCEKRVLPIASLLLAYERERAFKAITEHYYFTSLEEFERFHFSDMHSYYEGSQRLRPGEALLMYLKASKDTHDDSGLLLFN